MTLNWSPSNTTSTSNTQAPTVGMACLLSLIFLVSIIPFESDFTAVTNFLSMSSCNIWCINDSQDRSSGNSTLKEFNSSFNFSDWIGSNLYVSANVNGRYNKVHINLINRYLMFMP